MSKTHSHFRAVVFDMDGILIDSEPLFRSVAKQTAADLGYTLSDAVYVQWMGLPPKAVEAAVVQSMGPEFPIETFRERFSEHWTTHTDLHGVPAQPGIPELLAELQARDIPFAVATSTRRNHAERSLEMAGLASFIDVLVGGDEVEQGKPEPEIFQSAAKKIAVPAASCVALEDSSVGVRAASSARMLTIMVPDLHLPSAEIAALARFVVPSTSRAAEVVLTLFDSR
jgi:HAD superfamily hydrolase (TIGR01509 family)